MLTNNYFSMEEKESEPILFSRSTINRMLYNSPQTLTMRSLSVSPIHRAIVPRTRSEESLSTQREYFMGITAFQHVLGAALENISLRKVEQRELDIPILLVDDMVTNIKILKNMLKSLGFKNISTAKDGLEAVILCKLHAYDIIFMDGEMPVMDGLGAIEVIRKDEDSLNANTFIIIQSTCKDMVDKMKKAAGEHSTVIDKPYTKASTIVAFSSLSEELAKMIIEKPVSHNKSRKV